MITLREKVCIVVCIGVFGWAVIQRHAAPADKIVADDRVTKLQQQVHKTVTTVTKVVKPDGTKTETTTTEKEITKVERKTDDKQEVTTAPTPQQKTKYGLALEYEPSLTRSPQPGDVGIDVRARVADSDWWVDLGYSVKTNQVRVGVSREF